MKIPKLNEMKRVDVRSALPNGAKYITTLLIDDTLFIKDMMADIYKWENNGVLTFYCYYHF